MSDEYEAAVLDVVRCMGDAGFSVYTVEHGHVLVVRGTALPSLESVQKWNDAYDVCAAQWLRDVQEVWQLQHAPSERQLQERRAAMLGCVQDYNVDAASIEVVETLMGEGRLSERDRTAVLVCMARHMSNGADASVLEARLTEMDE